MQKGNERGLRIKASSGMAVVGSCPRGTSALLVETTAASGVPACAHVVMSSSLFQIHSFSQGVHAENPSRLLPTPSLSLAPRFPSSASQKEASWRSMQAVRCLLPAAAHAGAGGWAPALVLTISGWGELRGGPQYSIALLLKRAG